MSDHIRIEVIECTEYLFVRLHGVWNEKNGNQCIRDVSDLFIKSDHRDILVDAHTMTHIATVIADYLTAQKAVATELYKARRIAVIQKPELKENIELFEVTARNVGINVRFFHTEPEAIEWLTRTIAPA